MASFRSGIKIISDVSKLQGRTFLQNGQHLLGLRGNRSSGSRSKSAPCKAMTERTADETTSWFPSIRSRRERFEIETRPPPGNTQDEGGKFLVPPTGPRPPNRYYSAECCNRDPPTTFQAPPPSVHGHHTDHPTPSFIITLPPMKPEESGVCCGGREMIARTGGAFCDTRSTTNPFTLCPKPIVNPTIYKCTIPLPKERRQMVVKVDECEEPKPPPFKICPRPPPRNMQPMCLVLSGNLDEQKVDEPPPPPTPRRSLSCENEPVGIEMNRPPSVYKMDPDSPFESCPRIRPFGQEALKCQATDKQCQGNNDRFCDQIATSTSISEGPCVGAKSCLLRQPSPPQFSSPSASGSCSVDSTAVSPRTVLPSSTARKPLLSAVSGSKMYQSFSTAASLSKPPVSATHAAYTARCNNSSNKQSFSSSRSGGPAKTKKKNTTSSSDGACKKFTLPGCAPPARKTCEVKISAKSRQCSKIPVPAPCFTDCYKGPCPVKIVNPCPFVQVTHLIECDVTRQMNYLQPRSPIFEERKKFVLPPPVVDLVIDPDLANCCDPDKNPAPKPLSCEPAICVEPNLPSCAPQPTESKPGGCNCSVMKFIRSLMSYLKGERPSPGAPPDKVLMAAQAMADEPSSCHPVTTARSVKNETVSPSQGGRAKGSATKKDQWSDASCRKIRMPGCRDRVRQDCSTEGPKKSSCSKVFAPRPSFSECLRQQFPAIKCTECRVAAKRARSLVELRDLRLPVTPENLHKHYNKCLVPTSKNCDSLTLKSKHRPINRLTSLVVGKKDAPKNPPRPKREYCSPSSGTKPPPSQPPPPPSQPPPPASKPPSSQGHAPPPCKPPSSQGRAPPPCKPPSSQGHAPPPPLPPWSSSTPAKSPECDKKEKTCDEYEPYRLPKDYQTK